MFRLIVLITCLAIGGSEDLERKNSVKLTLFYESYCPASIQYIKNKLYSAWVDFRMHLQLDLVPSGSAEQYYSDGHFYFTCQHGPRECVANTLHACAIYAACGENGTLGCEVFKLWKAMDYINCVVRRQDQQAASNKCAKLSRLNPEDVNKCANGTLGEWLLSGYGNRTAAYHSPDVTYVPFICINDKHNRSMQYEAKKSTVALLCKYLPHLCVWTNGLETAFKQP